jgi:NAD(P)-dependent dehydrogenase (short-subunit alcohol dehydrogenase family)
MAKLENRVALVFAAGSVGPGWGNGKGSAVAYAREGAMVACVDWNKAAAEETAEIIRSEGRKAVPLTCDITKADQVQAAVTDTVNAFGSISILHNNVGHAKIGDCLELSEEGWKRQLDLNLAGMFLTCKHVLPIMLEVRKGVITNISSVAAIRWTGYAHPS